VNTLPARQLVNHGLLRTLEIAPSDTCTVIVVGLARSGTSMVAALLKSLGVFMGKAIDNAVFEDREIAGALESGNIGLLRELIAARNAAHRIWGFKRPEAYRRLDLLCSLCRNPRIIVTFRDILAISLRNNISMQTDPLTSLPGLADQYGTLVSEIKRLSIPCLLVSYEKALQYPGETAAEIARFCGLDATEAKIAEASQVVENGNLKYVEAARLRYQGFVDGLVNGGLRGWVKVIQRDGLRVNVELRLDGRLVQATRADLYRPDVQRAGFGDGRYGFTFEIDEKVSRDSIVDVGVQNSSISLQNSGLPLSKYSKDPVTQETPLAQATDNSS
jgi:hypothetical protein